MVPAGGCHIIELEGTSEHGIHLSVTLERAARTLVNVHYDAIRVTRQVYANIYFNLGHFFVNLRLQSGSV